MLDVAVAPVAWRLGLIGFSLAVLCGRWRGRPGMALVEMSVVEQRYRAVLAVERGEPKIVVAAQFGVSRQTLHTWLTRYARDGLAGLIDRSHRPPSCPHQA